MSLEKLSFEKRHLTAGRQPIEKRFFEPSIATDNCSCECHKTRDEVDKLLGAYNDVTSPQFRAWYCKAIYALGCQKFSDLAEQARTGKQPARYFSSLIKAQLGGRL